MSNNNNSEGKKPKQKPTYKVYQFLGGLYMPKGNVVEDIDGYANAIKWWNRQYAVASEAIAHIAANIDSGRGDDLALGTDLDCAVNSRDIAMESMQRYALKLAELTNKPKK